jgi:hypothetical protein
MNLFPAARFMKAKNKPGYRINKATFVINPSADLQKMILKKKSAVYFSKVLAMTSF